MIKSLFGTSGIRGSAKDLFTDQFSFDMGRVFSIFLRNHGENGWISIGNDPRESSPRIKTAVISGMIYEGREVYDEGVVSIPAINYILKIDSKFAGSLMVSGSHVKPELNGLKFFAFGEEILKDGEEEIGDIYEKEKGKILFENLKNNNLEQPHEENRAKKSYIEYLLSASQMPYPKWKVVVDPGNGAQSEIMPHVLSLLGLEVIKMNSDIQKTFLSRDTEVQGDFADLQSRVVNENSDLGIGYDSDGDRVVFIDEKGDFVPGDCSGTLIAKYLNVKKVVTPINTSQVVDRVGLEVVRTRVGSPFVVQKMKELNIPFGFEANGGGFYSNMKSRDGGRSTIEILNLLKKENISMSQVVDHLPKYYLLRDKVEYEWEQKDEILKKAKEQFKGIKTEELDGLKIWVDKNSWILFRSSMNAPEFRVFCESDVEEKAKDLLSSGMDMVKGFVDK